LELAQATIERLQRHAPAVTNESLVIVRRTVTEDLAKIKAAIAKDLTARQCRCASCQREVPSAKALAFFEYRPTKEFDIDYCGCRGWD
jgi:hypothetical protein